MSDQPVEPKPPAKPLFLNPDAANSAGYVGGANPDELTPVFDDEIQQLGLSENVGADLPREVRIRWLEVARLYALGRSPRVIGERLNYSPAWVRNIINRPEIQHEVHRYRSKLYDQDLLTAMKDLGPDAIKVLTEMLQDPKEKLKDRAEAAKWLLEKLTGKAKQEVTHESNTLAAFMEVLKKMQSSGESLQAPPTGQTIDVTPQPAEEKSVMPAAAPSKWANWSKDHI